MSRKLTTSETIFLALVMLSAISIVPSALWVYEKHPLAAQLILAATGLIVIFIALILAEKNPKIQVGP